MSNELTSYTLFVVLIIGLSIFVVYIPRLAYSSSFFNVHNPKVANAPATKNPIVVASPVAGSSISSSGSLGSVGLPPLVRFSKVISTSTNLPRGPENPCPPPRTLPKTNSPSCPNVLQ